MKTASRAAVWLLWVLVLAPSGARAERVLLAVGSSQGLWDEWPLTYAVRDAERFARVMVELGDVAPGNVFVLRDPSLDEFVRTVRKIGKSATSTTTFVLYYSGHGGEAGLHLRGESLTSAALRSEIARIPAALQLLIVDACRGAVARKGFARTEPFTISLGPSVEHSGLVILHAASSGEAALESNVLQSGVFSHYLISGLRGAADRDVDGRISLSEVYDYAYSSTLETSASSTPQLQHPTLDIDMQGVGPLVLTRVAPAKSILRLPIARDEQYLVFQKGSSAAYAEAWTHPTRATQLALPAGLFVVYRRSPRGAAAAEVHLPFGGERQLVDRDFAAVPAQQIKRRGGRYVRHDHSLAATFGAAVDGTGHVGPGAGVSYAHRSVGFTPTFDIGFTSQEFRTAANQVARQSLGFTPGVEYRFVAGAFNVGVGLGATATLLFQRLEARDDDQAPHDTATALGFGGMARARLALPFTPRFSWQLELLGASTFFREHDPEPKQPERIKAELKAVVTSGPAVAF